MISIGKLDVIWMHTPREGLTEAELDALWDDAEEEPQEGDE